MEIFEFQLPSLGGRAVTEYFSDPKGEKRSEKNTDQTVQAGFERPEQQYARPDRKRARERQHRDLHELQHDKNQRCPNARGRDQFAQFLRRIDLVPKSRDLKDKQRQQQNGGNNEARDQQFCNGFGFSDHEKQRRTYINQFYADGNRHDRRSMVMNEPGTKPHGAQYRKDDDRRRSRHKNQKREQPFASPAAFRGGIGSFDFSFFHALALMQNHPKDVFRILSEQNKFSFNIVLKKE